MAYEFIDASTLIARASIKAGCDFYAGYPISPSVPLHLFMMQELPNQGKMAIQGEDEIASISLCIGASMAGKKAMTATSGPGMSLYSENIGLAIMAEIPLVIVNVQRLGPATGGATTGAEGDIQFVRWITSGGMPMVILSPSSIESSYYLTAHAFNIAETLRTPVILLTSKDMALSRQTVDTDKLYLPEIENRKYFHKTDKFIPYYIEKTSSIPGFLPLGADMPVRFTTSMHDEHGYITKDPKKIEKKLRHLNDKIIENEKLIESVLFDPMDNAEILIISYGILATCSLEVCYRLRSHGKNISLLIIESLFPIPEKKIHNSLKGIKKIILPELNPGLYKNSIQHLVSPSQELISITQYNGELLSSDELFQRINLL